MKPRALDKIIREEGWEQTRISTGHAIYSKPGRIDQIILSWHNHSKDVPNRVEARIRSQLKRGEVHLRAKNRMGD